MFATLPDISGQENPDRTPPSPPGLITLAIGCCAVTFSVQSEVGRLRQVIVHRPGLELNRLSPRNVEELLFDEVMWGKRAQEEHDAFTAALAGQGVTVHYFGQLLSETLDLPEGRAFVLDRVCTPEMLGDRKSV